ncbi:MAG: hypothetical protein ABI923_07165 [bacterium]
MISAAGVVLATATYFNYSRLLGFLAVFTTILAIGLGHAIAGGMRAFSFMGL